MNPIEETAKELNLPYEQVEMVVNDLWKGIRETIANIENLKFGILLPFFRLDFQISIWYKEMKKTFLKGLEGYPKRQERYNYYKTILNNLPYSEKNPKHQRFLKVYSPKRFGDNT